MRSKLWQGVLTELRTLYKPPSVLIPHSVVEEMIREAQRYPDDETGQSLVGVTAPSGRNLWWRPDPDIIILGTIKPLDENTVRQPGGFEHGDEFQREVFLWLANNWDEYRKTSREAPEYNTFKRGSPVPEGFIPQVFDQPLIHPGDWHKHFGMTTPSEHDLKTAVNLLDDLEFVLAPTVSMKRSRPPRFFWQKNILTQESDPDRIEISFFLLSRSMIERGMQRFIEIEFQVVPEEELPRLPKLAWYLVRPDRMEQELNLLRDFGCQVGSSITDIDGKPPLEICFAIGRDDWQSNILAITQAEYPNKPPEIRILPKEGNPQPVEETGRIAALHRWSRWLSRSRQVGAGRVQVLPQSLAPGGLGWSPERFLLSLVMAMEVKLRCPETESQIPKLQPIGTASDAATAR